MSLKRTPFYSSHVAQGARMVPFAGFEMPVQYAGVKSEHHAVRTAVGLFDVSHMGEVFVRGPKAFDAIQYLVSNDCSKLVDGQALYTVMCNEEGGVVDDLVIYRLSAEEYLICVNAGNRDKDYAWIVAHNPHKAEIVDEGDRWVQLAIQGRKATATVQALTDFLVGELANYTARSGVTAAGIDGCIVARTGYTGEDGYEIFAPSSTGVALWQAVLDAGAEHGIVPVGLGARDTLRLEARMHLYGHELTDDTSPWQAGLARVVKMDKPGGFVGQAALARRKGNEARRLVALTMTGKRLAREHMPVTLDGEVIGSVCSGTRSPTLGHGIALAYIDRAYFKPGTEVIVDVRGRPAPAVVTRGAFYKRDY
ncbi:MAG: aminomethyltransferase [Kiritimatiellia bacterium]|jgi:aminomethyltransferase